MIRTFYESVDGEKMAIICFVFFHKTRTIVQKSEVWKNGFQKNMKQHNCFEHWW